MFRRIAFHWLAAVPLILGVPMARADYIAKVTLTDTTALQSNDSNFGPYIIDFQLDDGSLSGDQNNTAKISNVDLGGGSIAGPPTTGAPGSDVSGSLAGTITITDGNGGSPFFGVNDFQQSFHAGTSLSFDLDLTTNTEASPDAFSFSILDKNGNELANPPNGALLSITIDGVPPTITPDGGTVNGLPFNEPVISPLVSTPEPSTLVLMLSGTVLAGAASARRRFGARKRSDGEEHS